MVIFRSLTLFALVAGATATARVPCGRRAAAAPREPLAAHAPRRAVGVGSPITFDFRRGYPAPACRFWCEGGHLGRQIVRLPLQTIPRF